MVYGENEMRRFLSIVFLLTSALRRSANDGVVLLHGACRSSSSMKQMANALAAAGFTVENVNYSSRTANIDTLSEQVNAKALNDPKLQDCAKIHFVTHSLGGLLVR